MIDKTTTVQELRNLVEAFIDDREWYQFHTPKDLSMAISVEASELVEKFLWIGSQKSFQEVDKNREEIEQELADVVITAINFARAAKIDISSAIEKKMVLNAKKYPLEKAKGRYDKWDKL
ncbi:nucleotide pyrophosphohydrolase [bacterium]|nr:nucleotide pyrophosphohydrolase [bacterium]